MGLPGKKLSKSSKRRRAAHFALDPVQLVSCKKCAKPILPHRACKYCGTYKSRQVITSTRADVLIKEVSKDEVKKELAKAPAKKKTVSKK